MDSVKIVDGYSYLPDCNIIVNEEIESFNLDSEKIKPEEINVSPGLMEAALKNVSQMTLEITQDCNLRCQYCVNSDHYSYERKISKQKMAFEVAKRGLDYFYGHINSRLNKSFSIGFYGGEPLLEFELVKKIVAYSKKLFKNWDLRYALTTNGTVLTPEIQDFLIEHRFALTVSLDGPKKIHDAKRVRPNNNGSYDKVIENLSKIKNADSHYFEHSVRLNAVFSKDLPIAERIQFFNENPLLKNLRASASFVNYLESDYYAKNPYDKEKYFDEINTIKSGIKKKLLKKEKLNSIETFFENMVSVKHLNKQTFSDLGGACILSKCQIDANGGIHFCNRINNKFSFGNVHDGIDFKRLKEIVESYIILNKQHCNKCDFRFLCERCYIHFAKDGVFEFNREFCVKQKSILQDRLEENVLLQIDIMKDQGAQDSGNNEETESGHKNFKFHQFVFIEKGPVNSVIFDSLKGNVYQVENHYIETFQSNRQLENIDFINSLKEEQLIIEVNKDTWVPYIETNTELNKLNAKMRSFSFELDIVGNRHLDQIKQKIDMAFVMKINYYGAGEIEEFFPGLPVSYKEKNIDSCVAMSKANGVFKKITKSEYLSNMYLNSCWAKRIAITEDGNIRPCIYSDIVLGNICEREDIKPILEQAREHWFITKESVEKCKDCEYKYVCYDCREIAQRKGNGNLLAANPHCNYDPYSGKWFNC